MGVIIVTLVTVVVMTSIVWLFCHQRHRRIRRIYVDDDDELEEPLETPEIHEAESPGRAYPDAAAEAPIHHEPDVPYPGYLPAYSAYPAAYYEGADPPLSLSPADG